MNFNISIGQYYPINSYLHDLDPRTKLLGSFSFIVLLFFINSILGYIVSAIFLAIVIKLSNVPLKFMLKGLRALMGIIIFTVLLNMLFVRGENVIFSIWKINISWEGIIMALRMAVRLIMLLMMSSILTLTTTPMQLTEGIEYCLKPFKKIGIPSHEIAMMMTIALRFIPTLMEEADKIMKAQKARGADFETGNLLSRIKNLVPILIPLFVSAFRRADELAMAMEARCYRGDINRTRLKELEFSKNDFICMICLLIFAIVIIYIRFILK